MQQGLVIVIVCIAGYIMAQLAKNLIWAVTGDWTPGKVFKSGGMPSSHASTVAALATSVLVLEGFSVAFGMSAVLLAIVASDACGVRRHAGLTAAAVNKAHSTTLETSLGHTWQQVLAGMLMGVLAGLLTLLF